MMKDFIYKRENNKKHQNVKYSFFLYPLGKKDIGRKMQKKEQFMGIRKGCIIEILIHFMISYLVNKSLCIKAAMHCLPPCHS